MINAVPEKSKMENENKFCRLCLEESELIANLFEEQLPSDNSIAITLSQKLFELFQIKYEETPTLPNRICKECLQMIESFTTFRENVHKIESELQKRVASLKYGGGGVLKVIEESPRPGLNDNPGTFVPEEGAIIIEINPDEDYGSSDDDFSMDSDSEAEPESSDMSKSENNQQQTTPPSQKVTMESQILAAHRKISMDVEMSKVMETPPPVGNKVKEISLLTESNIIEKSYTMEGIPTKITYSCQYCDMAFSEQKECAEHVSHHDQTLPYMCSFCGMRFTNRQHLIAHIRQLHDRERPFVCALCNKGFVRRSDLRKHSIVHTGLRPFTCNICTKSFSRNTNLTKHMRIHSNGDKPHVCSRCPRSFATGAELMRHARSHIINKPFHCTKCSASFTRRDKLAQHEQTQHNNNSSSSNAASAPLLPAIDFNQQQQQQQQNSTTINTLIASNEQNLNATTSAAANPEDTPHRNSILAAQLQQPRLNLSSQKSFPVPLPSKPSHFSRHFACDVCQMTFTRERDYQRHQALHLDTLFSCKQCGIGFSRREKLARHELEQHAPQYPCNICRMVFTKVSDFELHMKMHELQQSVTMTAQAASLLSAGANLQGFGINPQPQLHSQQHQHHQQHAMQHHAQSTAMAPPPPPPLKEHLGMHQRPSVADMNFYSQMVPTMNLGFYSETRPEDRNGI